MKPWRRRRPYVDLQGAGADIVIPHRIAGDADPRLQNAIDLAALELGRHIGMADVALVHLQNRATLVYVVR